ncbi:putative receptor-like protein kinase [Quercus suber]|uniref:Receptor-like protein kinase n=1 Tax=Quercus suber TaxID=58331 RepID=A0AAW0J1S8_QUESU
MDLITSIKQLGRLHSLPPVVALTKHCGSYHPLAKWWRWSRPDPYKRDFSRRTASSLPGELCRYFRLDEIKTATNNFNEDLIIGVGGFGNVYKGLIEQGNVLESNSGTELSTINTGLSYPSLDSIIISITSEDVSSSTKNSSS